MKCVRTREAHSIPCWTRRLRRPLGNPRQNSAELLIPHVSAVVAESVFVQVGLQHLGADAVVDPANSSFHQAPKSFDSLSVNVSGDIDFRAVTDALVDVAVFFQSIIRNVIVGENGAARKDIFLRQSVKGFTLRVVSYASDHAARALRSAALDHSDDGYLMALERWPSLSALSPSLSAVVHLIHLHRRALQLHIALRKQRANLPENAPRGFVGNASLALNLLGGNSTPGRAHEIHRVKPSLERSSGLLKDGSREGVNLGTAMVAAISGAALDSVVLALHATLRALSHAPRPALLRDVLKAGVIVRKLFVEVSNGISQFLRDALFGFHAQSIPNGLRVVKG